MYQNRLNKLWQKMQKESINAALISNSAAVYYYSGANVDDSYLLVLDGHAVLLTDGRYTEQLARECPDVQVACRKSGQTLIDLAAELLKKDEFIRLAFEDNSLIAADYLQLQDKLPDATLLPASAMLNDLRRVKSPQEIELMKKAASIADEALERVSRFIKPDVSEMEIARRLEFAMLELGADGVSFPTIVAAGPHSAQPHAKPSDFLLQEGMLLVIDFGAKYKGYCSDMTRTFAIGHDISNVARNVYETVAAAQMLGASMVRPGVRCSDIHNAVMDYFIRYDMGEYFVHSLGHGVGLEIHEAPTVSSINNHVLEVGEVITIEPGLYLPELCGVRIEDTVLVTEQGCKPLNNFPKKLKFFA